MNAAHFHLVINHFPAILTIAAILTGTWAWFRDSRDGKKIALAMIVAGGVFALASYFSGEPASEFLESTAIVNDMYIEEHESAAGYAVTLSTLAAILALVALVYSQKGQASSAKTPAITRRLELAAAALSLLTLGSLAYTGLKGGVIRHPELSEYPGALPRIGTDQPTGNMDESGEDSDQETEFQLSPSEKQDNQEE